MSRIEEIGISLLIFTGIEANIRKSGRRIKEVWCIVKRFKDFWRGSSRYEASSLSVGII